jgi:hypothetical protein
LEVDDLLQSTPALAALVSTVLLASRLLARSGMPDPMLTRVPSATCAAWAGRIVFLGGMVYALTALAEGTRGGRIYLLLAARS